MRATPPSTRRTLGTIMFATVAATLLYAAAPLLAPAGSDPVRRPELRSEQACGAAGGVWSRAGLQGVGHCVRRTLDAGRVCQGRNDCESLCVTDDETPAGTQVNGRCFEWTQTVGHCYNRVKNGAAVGLVCKD